MVSPLDLLRTATPLDVGYPDSCLLAEKFKFRACGLEFVAIRTHLLPAPLLALLPLRQLIVAEIIFPPDQVYVLQTVPDVNDLLTLGYCMSFHSLALGEAHRHFHPEWPSIGAVCWVLEAELPDVPW
eukprot:6185908-Pleurochrysis_carterae.AAC.2